MVINTATLNDDEIMNLSAGPVPLTVQVRFLLNKKGIKFKDDGRCVSIANESPIPLGSLTESYDIDKRLTTYKQEI